MSKGYTTVWQGEGYAEPIRGQQSSMFFDSRGRKCVKAKWIEEKTYRSFCGVCTFLIRSRGLSEVVCPKCGTVNDVT